MAVAMEAGGDSGLAMASVSAFLSHYIAGKPVRETLKSARTDMAGSQALASSMLGVVKGAIKHDALPRGSQSRSGKDGMGKADKRQSLTFGTTVIVIDEEGAPSSAQPPPPATGRIVIKQPKALKTSSGQCRPGAVRASSAARVPNAATRARLQPRPRTCSPLAAPAYSRSPLAMTFPPAKLRALGVDANSRSLAESPPPSRPGTSPGAWTGGATLLPLSENSIGDVGAAAMAASMSRRKCNFDVFLCDDKSGWPMLGRTREPLRNPPPPPKSVDIILGSGGELVENVTSQLTAFEKQHEKLFRTQQPAENAVAKAVTNLKQNRVRQLMGLKKSPLPMLFLPLDPAKVKQLYVEYCGGITSDMTLGNFSAMLSMLIAPEPPLPDQSVRWIFKAVDKDESGSVDFVEFISTIYSVVTPQRVKDSVSKLFGALSYMGYIPACHLNTACIVEAVRRLTDPTNPANIPPTPGSPRDRENPGAGGPFNAAAPAAPADPVVMARRTLNMWRVTAAMIAEAASDLRAEHCLAPDEFQTLLYLNRRIVDQIGSAPL